MSLLELHDIAYRYPHTETPAVEEFSGVIESGKITALLGCNGSGKSTIGKIASGLISPLAGSVKLDGNSLKAGWNGIGALFQFPDDQFVTSTVESELAFGLENLAIESNVINNKVDYALSRFNLELLRYRSPEQLSDGQKQLVALASVLLMRPKFLILDEAVSFLDWGWQKRIWQSIVEVTTDTGILWITTRTSEAARADEVWLIDSGKLIGSGNPESILAKIDLEQIGLAPL